jgi:signal transduction histidine kinase
MMFRNLSTGTKLLLLCGVFFIAIAVPIYRLIIEQQIAIDFTRKELVGSRYLAVSRAAYAAILLCEAGSANSSDLCDSSFDRVNKGIVDAKLDTGGDVQAAELERSLIATLHQLSSAKDLGTLWNTYAVAAMTSARELASRISDDYNLALDSDLDTYHLQDIVVGKLTAVMTELGEVQIIVHEAAAADGLSSEHKVRLLMLDGLLRSTSFEVRRDLAAAYRADNNDKLKHVLDPAVTEMVRSTGLYLNAVSTNLLEGQAVHVDTGNLAELFRGAIQSDLNAWTAIHGELDRLLRERVISLIARLRGSLMLTGALALVSVLLAIVTHRSIVPPLKQLADVANEVSQTKNYGLRVKAIGKDEVARLGATFNDMLAELANASDRERAAQMELARVARLTAAGALTASIAHEVNQPLAAVVSNANAALRLLGKVPPNLNEAEQALEDIVSDGNRASEVIESIRSMFKTDGQTKTLIDLNVVIRQTLALVQGEFRSKRITVKPELLEHLPPVPGSRVQLQEVVLNLIMNAVDAMALVADRARLLRIRTGVGPAPDVITLSLEDSGPGIDPEHAGRIFDAFFTTKSQGMGMGLSISRRIVEAHGGRIWASSGSAYGSIFHVELPTSASDSG